jgi:hypothetical protein
MQAGLMRQPRLAQMATGRAMELAMVQVAAPGMAGRAWGVDQVVAGVTAVIPPPGVSPIPASTDLFTF